MSTDDTALSGIILVVGCQRSGTTLVGQMVGAHPSTLLIDEDDGGYDVVAAICEQAPLQPVLDRVLPRARRKYSDARQAAAGVPSHVVLKAPNATFHAPSLERSQLPLRFVFPVRDVREVVHSMMQLRHVPMIANQHRRMSQDPATAARFAAQIRTLADPGVANHIKFATIWQVKTGLYRDFCAPPLSALQVPYDALVAHPDQWRTRLQEHLGLPQSLLAHQEVMHGTAVGNTDRGRAVDAGSRARWHGAFSPAQLEEIREVADELMTQLGLAW